MKITFSVTKTDIETGRMNCRENCMVAKSISRRLKPGYTVRVNGGSFKGSFKIWRDWRPRHKRTGKAIRAVVLPERVAQAIAHYDAGKVVKPFRFTITLTQKEQIQAFA